MRDLPLGKFACEFTLDLVRPPVIEREEKDGVTYLVGRNYEMAYRTTLRFESGAELPILATLVGDLNQQVVIRDRSGKPAGISGCVQGRSRITDKDGNLMFEGTYYDARVTQALSGDDALTGVGPRVIEHLENGFGRGAYAGHALSLSIRLVRDGDERRSERGSGYID
jgi:hypothetical protein